MKSTIRIRTDRNATKLRLAVISEHPLNHLRLSFWDCQCLNTQGWMKRSIYSVWIWKDSVKGEDIEDDAEVERYLTIPAGISYRGACRPGGRVLGRNWQTNPRRFARQNHQSLPHFFFGAPGSRKLSLSMIISLSENSNAKLACQRLAELLLADNSPLDFASLVRSWIKGLVKSQPGD